MRSRYEVYVDGIALSSLNPAIIITDVSHAAANCKRQTQAIAKRNGLVLVNFRQETTSVTVSFMLRLYKIAERQAALAKIQAWAQGKVLETNDRDGQRLYVVCDAFPTIGSVQAWNGTLTVKFTAYDKPFWEEKTASVLSLTGDDEEGTLYVPGNAGKALVEAEITPSETIDELTITVDETVIELDELNTAQKITIGYDQYGNQYIKAGATSILSKRTPESSDDLEAWCGKRNAVAVECDKSVVAKITARGLWL